MTRSNGIGIGAGIAVAAVAGLFVMRGNATAPLHGADVSVSCGPTQRAVVRQTVETGKPKVDIDCVTGAPGLQAATYVIDERGQVVPALDPGVVPVAAPAIVPAVYQPRVSRGPADEAPLVRAPRRTVSATTARARQGRTWQQRALIIGGSAGAGAGVGALIGGKKGALIGAAAGGGGAALIDALRNR